MIRFAQLHRELPPRALTREPIKMTDHQQQPNDGQSHSSGIKTVTIRLDDTLIAAVTLLTDFSPRIARMHLIGKPQGDKEQGIHGCVNPDRLIQMKVT